MKNSDRDVDALIREALTQDEAEAYHRLEDPGLPEMVADVFRGKLRYFSILTMLLTLVFFAASVYAAVRFYQAPELREMMLWGALLFYTLSVTMALKIWQWMEMQRHAVTREVKRLELRVAHLAAEIHGNGAAKAS